MRILKEKKKERRVLTIPILLVQFWVLRSQWVSSPEPPFFVLVSTATTFVLPIFSTRFVISLHRFEIPIFPIKYLFRFCYVFSTRNRFCSLSFSMAFKLFRICMQLRISKFFFYFFLRIVNLRLFRCLFALLVVWHLFKIIDKWKIGNMGSSPVQIIDKC